MRLSLATALAASLILPLAACQTDGQGVASTGTPGLTTTSSGGSTGSGVGGSGVPALINVNLSNVLNDLSVQLSIDRANIPVNAQIPISVAANVCGVSVDVLAASVASGQGSCTAQTASQELAQVVQQQVAAGGSVGGGSQGGSTAASGGSSPTGGASSGGATGTGGSSAGANMSTGG